ncbi:MAG: Phosphoribosyltransferase [Parcubacteria group bacterium GW2011_GWA1_47_8]|nr:MAG: Phosphoribosyltransferase [Parcubacteria group bacterium GW2011_GWA1_47_8]
MKKFFTHILNIFFPIQCLGCATPNVFLCATCMRKIPRARNTEHAFTHAVFDYRNPILKDAIWKFKYAHARGLARDLARPLYEEMLGVLGERLESAVEGDSSEPGKYGGEKILLVPIPLHPKRLRERGYNQSELLARAVIACDENRIFELAEGVLVRTRQTPPQARAEKRTARLANMRDAFHTKKMERVRGRTVILIDDVTTTGATLLEAKRALIKARPRAVLAFAVGH